MTGLESLHRCQNIGIIHATLVSHAGREVAMPNENKVEATGKGPIATRQIYCPSPSVLRELFCRRRYRSFQNCVGPLVIRNLTKKLL